MAVTDGSLVAAIKSGDSKAFADLVARYEAPLQRIVRGVVGDEAEAEDVAQDAILAAYLNLDRLRNPAAFSSWLYGIGLNLARMRVRSRRRAVSFDDVAGSAADAEPTPQQAIEAAELFSLVRASLEGLPDGQRDVVLLYYYEGLTCQEIAALLGLSTGSVRVRLHRARGRLRDRLRVLRPKEVSTMVEMVFEDVIAKDVEADAMRVVLLRERDGERLLPIWIGAAEGDSLALHLGGESLPRPLTSDLTARLLEAVGAQVEHVVISRLSEKTYYASVRVGSSDVDARPSDALNLAARVDAPILAVEEVLDEAALEGERLQDELHAMEKALGRAPDPGAKWETLTATQVKEAWLARQTK
jgi:RNA polymerase sigma factor (sigma-70 family)